MYLRQEEWRSNDKYTGKEMWKIKQKISKVNQRKKNLDSWEYKPVPRKRKDIRGGSNVNSKAEEEKFANYF